MWYVFFTGQKTLCAELLLAMQTFQILRGQSCGSLEHSNAGAAYRMGMSVHHITRLVLVSPQMHNHTHMYILHVYAWCT